MSVLIAVAVFFPMLAVLVVVHEMGHFLTARGFGVKVLEFGFGYPPRLFGLRTGRTRVQVDGFTRYTGVAELVQIPVGSMVKLGLVEREGADENAPLVARTVEVQVRKQKAAEQPAHIDAARADDLNTEGIVRAVDGDSLVVADMLYSFNILPLGGFVRLAGENNPNVPRSLAGKGTGARFIVISAGAFMNAVLAIAILSAIFMIPRDVEVGDVVVNAVEPGSPAELAGVLPGDVIRRAGGAEVETIGELSRSVALSLGSTMEWTIEQGGRTRIISLEPRWTPPEGQGATGVQVALTNTSIESRSDPPWEAVPNAFGTIGDMLLLARNEFSRWIKGGDSPDLAGPVGIAQATGEIAEEGRILLLVGFAAFLSMNLAIVNILPIPMLDGGHLVFVFLEWVRRGKRVSAERQGMVHLIGFVLLISVVLIVSYLDIVRIVQGDSLLG